MGDSDKTPAERGMKTSKFFLGWLISYGVAGALVIEHIDILRASLPFDIAAFWWIQTLILGPVIIHEIVIPLKTSRLIIAIVSPVTVYIALHFFLD